MTIARVPSLAHWGAFTAIVEDGRVVACEPFAQDDAPRRCSPPFRRWSIRPCASASRQSVTAGAKVRRAPAVTASAEIEWDEALNLVASEIQRVRSAYGDTAIFGGSYGWSSAGRLHHARSLVRRFLFQGGGCVDQLGNYRLGRGTNSVAACDWHLSTGHRPRHRLGVDRQAYQAHHRLRRPALVQRAGDLGRRRRTFPESWLHRAKAAGIKFVIISPTKSDAPDFLKRNGFRSDRIPTPP